jgi:hypothetical protein
MQYRRGNNENFRRKVQRLMKPKEGANAPSFFKTSEEVLNQLKRVLGSIPQQISIPERNY